MCASCEEVGHRSSASPLCPNHNPTKKEVFQTNLGSNYKAFTRKLPLTAIVKEEYQELLRQKVITTSRDLRHIIFRAMCFVNYFCFCSDRSAIPNDIFTQPYWYSMCQLVNGRNITNSKNTSDNLIQTWNEYCTSFPNIVYKEKLQAGASNCLAEACTELATSYTNNIVENFESRLIKYIKYKLKHMFMVSSIFIKEIVLYLLFYYQ